MSQYSIIIPSRNHANLRACLEAVRYNEDRARVIVIWDGPAEELPLFYTSTCEPMVTITGAQPFIFARNINIGIDAAGADDVVLLNDDAILRTPAGFAMLRYQAEAHPEYGAICPGFTPGSVGTIGLVWRGRPHLAQEHVMLVFACVYIPRRTIDLVGKLDERFGINAGGEGPRGYGLEDDDYSYRIKQAGLKLGVYDPVLVDHTPSGTGLLSTFRHDPERPHDVRAHEDLFREIHGHWPEGHGFAPRGTK